MIAIKGCRIIILCALVLTVNSGFAQFTDTLAQIAKVVFYEKSVYKKLFIEHKDYVEEPSVLLMLNMPMARKYPDLTDKMNTHDKVGKQIHSTIFLNDKAGLVILTLPRYDSSHVLFAGFHKFSYSSTEASVEIHTTSKYMIDSLADRYIKILCSLRNKNGEWKIEKLKMEKNDCCKDYPHYALDILDERHYK